MPEEKLVECWFGSVGVRQKSEYGMVDIVRTRALFHLYLRGPGATKFHELLREFRPILTDAGNR